MPGPSAYPTQSHLLFVDDEPHVLAALRRILRPRTHRWLISYADSARDAVAVLKTRPCHVIICDYHMPGTGGAALLQYVSEVYPDTARVILTAETNEDELRTAMSVAHRFLAKPCFEEEIINTVEALLRTPPTPRLSIGHVPVLAGSSSLARP